MRAWRPLTAMSSMRMSLSLRRPMVISGLSSGNSLATTPSISKARLGCAGLMRVMATLLQATDEDDSDVVRAAGLVGGRDQGFSRPGLGRVVRQRGCDGGIRQRLGQAVRAQQVNISGLQPQLD